MTRAGRHGQGSRWFAGNGSRRASDRAHPLAVLVLTGLLAAFTAPAGAAARWYTVEIIVFDDLYDEGLHAEHWPPHPGAPSLDNAVELVPGSDAHGFRLVDRSELTLGTVWSRLRGTARYRPFLHVGWRQPVVRRGAARPAQVGPGLGLAGAGASTNDGGERPAVQGTVQISLGRFLEVEVDLVYSRPAGGEATASDAAPSRFRLASERRMRSRELHYLDHPLFGVLMWIAPL